MAAVIGATQASRRVLNEGDKRIGYLHLWVMRDEILGAMKDAMSGFSSAQVDAVIFDLRGGLWR
jgi:C-terminal processing protease CtpA/Prc